jgi:hypothetical protein
VYSLRCQSVWFLIRDILSSWRLTLPDLLPHLGILATIILVEPYRMVYQSQCRNCMCSSIPLLFPFPWVGLQFYSILPLTDNLKQVGNINQLSWLEIFSSNNDRNPTGTLDVLHDLPFQDLYAINYSFYFFSF